jgi:hypothetical protein
MYALLIKSRGKASGFSSFQEIDYTGLFLNKCIVTGAFWRVSFFIRKLKDEVAEAVSFTAKIGHIARRLF